MVSLKNHLWLRSFCSPVMCWSVQIQNISECWSCVSYVVIACCSTRILQAIGIKAPIKAPLVEIILIYTT